MPRAHPYEIDGERQYHLIPAVIRDWDLVTQIPGLERFRLPNADDPNNTWLMMHPLHTDDTERVFCTQCGGNGVYHFPNGKPWIVSGPARATRKKIWVPWPGEADLPYSDDDLERSEAFEHATIIPAGSRAVVVRDTRMQASRHELEKAFLMVFGEPIIRSGGMIFTSGAKHRIGIADPRYEDLARVRAETLAQSVAKGEISLRDAKDTLFETLLAIQQVERGERFLARQREIERLLAKKATGRTASKRRGMTRKMTRQELQEIVARVKRLGAEPERQARENRRKRGIRIEVQDETTLAVFQGIRRMYGLSNVDLFALFRIWAHLDMEPRAFMRERFTAPQPAPQPTIIAAQDSVEQWWVARCLLCGGTDVKYVENRHEIVCQKCGGARDPKTNEIPWKVFDEQPLQENSKFMLVEGPLPEPLVKETTVETAENLRDGGKGPIRGIVPHHLFDIYIPTTRDDARRARALVAAQRGPPPTEGRIA